MKKTLLMMAVAAGAMLTGCVKNETANGGAVSGSKISFEAPAVTGITRAALVPGEIGTGYDQGEHFSVYALYFANGTYTEFGDGTLYMDNVETAYNTGGQYWDSESVPGGQAYYWPKKGSLTFAAYSPTGAANDCTTVAWGAAGFTFTNFTVQSEPAKHYDLLFSERAYNKTQSAASSTAYKGGVDITFKHALSSVVFKAKLGDTYEGHTITLKNITLKNTFTTGTFNQGLVDENNAVTTAAAWTGQDNENTAGYVAFDGAEVINSTTAAEPADATRLIVLPQDLAHETNNVTIDVTYSINSGGLEYDDTKTIDITQGYGLTEFEIGKRYTFTLIFGLDKITFSPEVDPWEDVPGIDIEL